MKTSLHTIGSGFFTLALVISLVPFDHILNVIDQSFKKAEEKVKDAELSEEQTQHVSNVLKTRHDTVKNSINNIR